MPTKRERMAAWLQGEGIEIGALHHPLQVPAGATVRYVDRMSEAQLREHYPEIDPEAFAPISIIGDAQNLTGLSDGSVDFVIANHLLEHLEDPIRGLAEMTRVLRPGGVLYLALPEPRATFDAQRPLTTVAHILDEHRDGTEATRRAHYEEYVRFVDTWDAAPLPARVDELMSMNYSIHFHVWRPDTFLDLLTAAKTVIGIDAELLAFEPCTHGVDNEFIFVLRKGIGATPPTPPPPAADGAAEVHAEDTTPAMLDRTPGLETIYGNRFDDEDETAKAPIWREIAVHLQRYLPPGPVVDIACDRGHLIRHIVAGERWAVDVRDVTSYLPPDVHFVQTDGAHLADKLPRDHFAAALLSNYLEHLPNSEAVIQQLVAVRDILRPKGRVIILQPNVRYCGAAYWDFIDHHTALTERSLVEAAEIAGLRTLTLIPRFLPYTTKSRLPQRPWMVRGYLRFPPAWRLLGKQTLYVGERV